MVRRYCSFENFTKDRITSETRPDEVARTHARSYPEGCHCRRTESAGLSRSRRTSVPRGPVDPLSHPISGIDCAGGGGGDDATTAVVLDGGSGGDDDDGSGMGRPFLLDNSFHIDEAATSTDTW